MPSAEIVERSSSDANLLGAILLPAVALMYFGVLSLVFASAVDECRVAVGMCVHARLLAQRRHPTCHTAICQRFDNGKKETRHGFDLPLAFGVRCSCAKRPSGCRIQARKENAKNTSCLHSCTTTHERTYRCNMARRLFMFTSFASSAAASNPK